MLKNCRLINPVVYGDYPDIVKKNAGSRLPVFTEKEAKLVKGSFDFLGVIHYHGVPVKDDPDSLKTEPRDVFADMGADMFGKYLIPELISRYSHSTWILLPVLKRMKMR